MSQNTLYEKLQKASSEEDVKAIYADALGLKNVLRNLVDMQTDKIWFEAKKGTKKSIYDMYTQLLYYVDEARNKGIDLPPFLGVIDQEKGSIMKTTDTYDLLDKKNIPWGKSASQYSYEALSAVSNYIGTYIIDYKIATHGDEFIEAVKHAIKTGDLIRTQITPYNIKEVFDKWVEAIGKEINDVTENDYVLLFYADIMNDGNNEVYNDLPASLAFKGVNPFFTLGNLNKTLNSHDGYKKFWQIYDRPPAEEYRNYLLERRDSLIPLDEKAFKGAYYTPIHIVEKAYEKLASALGTNWQEEYIVWDMCCGVGNLETKHSNPRNIYMSTLEEKDINTMKSVRVAVGAEKFQYDYLNDDIDEQGNIDYSLTNKIPARLQKMIKEGKKILVLMNPPYAEAGYNIDKESSKNKVGVAKTKFAKLAMEKYGKASNELLFNLLPA